MNKMRFLILIVGAVSWSLQAAGPVTHVILAQKWLDTCEKQYTPADRKNFIIGTLFPDVRYLADLPREKTHAAHITLEQIGSETNAFTAGSLFHSWVDNVREYYLKDKKGKILPRLKSVCSLLASNYLKFLEDQIYFVPGSWDDVKEDLKTITDDERKSDISTAMIEEWHHDLITQLSYPPSGYFGQMAQQHKRYYELPPDVVVSWSLSLPKNAAEPFFKNYAKELMAFFDQQLANCASTSTYPYEKAPESIWSLKGATKWVTRVGQQYVWPLFSQQAKDEYLEEQCGLLS